MSHLENVEDAAMCRQCAKSYDAELATLRTEAGLYREIVKRIRGAFIAAHLGEWTQWQAAIDLFLKAAQAQAHFARLASERYDKLLEKDRETADLTAEIASLRAKLADVEQANRVARDPCDQATERAERAGRELGEARKPDLLRIARAALAAEEYVPCTCDPDLPHEQCPGCVLREALKGTDDAE